MARHWKIAIVCVAILAVVGLVTLPGLLRSVLRLRRASVTEEQARIELNQPAMATPTDALVQAQFFWASATSPTMLEASQVALPLSADPVQRAKQLIVALITQVPNPTQRTLPADCELLQFYLLPDGTAIADFSEALSMETPSGILSEQMTVDSLVRTLAENVSAVHQLKILIRGQEQDTLAGHIDLTGYFPVVPSTPPAPPASQSVSQPSNSAPPSAPSQPASGMSATVSPTQTALPSQPPQKTPAVGLPAPSPAGSSVGR
jgi:hypothetical protein